MALVFRDITERRKAEKEREELLKEKARGELSNFVVSALPVFASNIPPQVRTNIARSFSDSFERNMKPHFDTEFKECIRESEDNNILFNCYIEWISDFFSQPRYKHRKNMLRGKKLFQIQKLSMVR